MVDTKKIEIVEKEKNQPIHQWVYQVLRTNIIKLHLFPGQQISETEVSDALGISRTPVREAFIRLAEDGFIEIKPQKGSSVSLIDLDQAEDARFIRRAIEKSVIKEACGSFPDLIRADLEANIRDQLECQAAKTYERMMNDDNDFHRLIYLGCRKEQVWTYIKKLDFNYDRLRIMTIPQAMDKIINEHRQILEIITKKRIEAVDAILEEHLTQAVINKVVLEYPPNYFKQDRKGASGKAL